MDSSQSFKYCAAAQAETWRLNGKDPSVPPRVEQPADSAVFQKLPESRRGREQSLLLSWRGSAICSVGIAQGSELKLGALVSLNWGQEMAFCLRTLQTP